MRTKPTPDEPKDPQKSLILRVPEDWHEFLRTKAFKERTTMTDLIREALRQQYGLKVV